MEGEIAGVLYLKSSSRPRLRHLGEFGLSVRKKHWGKGIGTLLLQSMLEWAAATKIIRKINLYVHKTNTKAIALYEKFGFEKEGLIRREIFFNGEFHDTYVMGVLID